MPENNSPDLLPTSASSCMVVKYTVMPGYFYYRIVVKYTAILPGVLLPTTADFEPAAAE